MIGAGTMAATAVTRVLRPLLVLAALAGPALAAPEDWDCDAGLCTARTEALVTRLTGTYDYGANLPRDGWVDRLAELEQQRWREFRFVVTERSRIYARGSVDQDYVPEDWPPEIGLGNVSVDVSRHFSLDGESYKKVEDGFILPAGAYLSIVVGQDTSGVGGAHATYYPARWSVDIGTRLVVEEVARDSAADPAAVAILADTGAEPLGRPGDVSADLDVVIDAALGCDGVECREPDDEPSATYSDGTAVVGPAIDPNAVDTRDGDDPTLAIDPTVDCGVDQVECKPMGDVEEPVASDPRGDPLAAELQAELVRVGCYDAVIDGFWGPVSRRAMTNFNLWAGTDVAVETPTPKALVAVARADGPVCGVD